MTNKILHDENFHIIKKLHDTNETLKEGFQRLEGQMNIIASQLFSINESIKEGFEDAVIKYIHQDRSGLVREITDEIEKRNY